MSTLAAIAYALFDDAERNPGFVHGRGGRHRIFGRLILQACDRIRLGSPETWRCANGARLLLVLNLEAVLYRVPTDSLVQRPGTSPKRPQLDNAP